MKRKMVWFGIPWLAGLFLATACQTSVTVSLLLAAFLLLGAFRLYRRITTGQLLCVGLSAASGAAVYYCRVPAASAICRNHNYIFRQSFRGKSLR